MYMGNDGVMHAKVFQEALDGTNNKIKRKIRGAYKDVDANVSLDELVNDETNAFYASKVLRNRNTLERLVQKEPSPKEKILSFFRGASKDYTADDRLARASRRYYKTFKKLFDEFSQRNKQRNAEDGDVETALMREQIDGNSDIVILDADSPLYHEILASGKKISTFLKEYIIKMYNGKEIEFSDGVKAIVDNTDAKKLAKHAGRVKVSQISQLDDKSKEQE